MTESTCLPDDKESLREMVIALQAQNSSYKKSLRAEQAKVSALDQHIATLEHQLAALRRPVMAEVQNSSMNTFISWS